MLPSRNRIVTVIRALVHEARVERVTFMAGSIAYHAFVSLLPLLLLVLAAVSALGSSDLQEGLISLAAAVLTPGASQALVGELQTANTSTSVSVLGILLLVWGTLRIFRSLDTAFSDIYESGSANTFTDQILDGIVVLVAVALAILVGAFVETQLGGLSTVSGGWVVERFVLAVGLAVVLFPMYYVFPDETGMQFREAVPGALFAAAGLTAFQGLFGLYIQVSSRSPTESLLAGILVFLTWLYFSGLVILLGAVVNAVLTNRSVDISIEPVVGGVSPTLDATAVAEKDLTQRLQQLEERLGHAETVTVTVDGEETKVPAPTSVKLKTENRRLQLAGRSTAFQLSWSHSEPEQERTTGHNP